MNKLIWNLLRIRVDKVLGYKSGTLGYCISERERERERVIGKYLEVLKVRRIRRGRN